MQLWTLTAGLGLLSVVQAMVPHLTPASTEKDGKGGLRAMFSTAMVPLLF